MTVNRRGFLMAAATAFTIDPDRLLWRPGAKLISIPKPDTFTDNLTEEHLRALRALWVAEGRDLRAHWMAVPVMDRPPRSKNWRWTGHRL